MAASQRNNYVDEEEEEIGELPLYSSMEEAKPCSFCGKELDDPVKLGKKVTVGDITAHHFCLVFSSNLRPVENDNDGEDGMFGFSSSDIKKDICRAKKLVNMQCREMCLFCCLCN